MSKHHRLDASKQETATGSPNKATRSLLHHSSCTPCKIGKQKKHVPWRPRSQQLPRLQTDKRLPGLPRPRANVQARRHGGCRTSVVPASPRGPGEVAWVGWKKRLGTASQIFLFFEDCKRAMERINTLTQQNVPDSWSPSLVIQRTIRPPALKPSTGTLEVPVANCRNLAKAWLGDVGDGQNHRVLVASPKRYSTPVLTQIQVKTTNSLNLWTPSLWNLQ